MNQTLTKDQVQTILNNTPKNIKTDDIIQGLINRGYKLQGMDQVEGSATSTDNSTTTTPEPSLIDKLKNRVNDFKTGAVQVKDSAVKAVDQAKQAKAENNANPDLVLDPQTVIRRQIEAQNTGLDAAAGAGKMGNAILGGASDVINTGISEVAKATGADQLLSYGIKSLPDSLKNFVGVAFNLGKQGLDKVAPEGSPQREVANMAGNAFNIVGAIDGAGAIKKGVTSTAKATVEQTKNFADATLKTFGKVTPVVENLGINPEFAGNVVKSVVAQSSGVTPIAQDIIKASAKNGTFDAKYSTEILNNPAVKEQEVIKSVITDLQDILANRGKVSSEYKGVLEKAKPFKFNDKEFVKVITDNTKLQYNPKTGFIRNADTVQISDADLAKLNSLVNVYKGQKTITGQQFLNLRRTVSDLAYEGGIKTQSGQYVADQIRGALNDTYRSKIKGLAELDAKFGPVENDIKNLKEFFNKDQNGLSDRAVSEITNLLNRGKESKLARIEKVIPDLRDRLEYAYTLRNIAAAQGNMVGTYGRAGQGIIAAGVGGSVAGIPGIVGSLIAHAVISNPITVVKAIGKFSK